MKDAFVSSTAVDKGSSVPPRTLTKSRWDTLQNCPAEGGGSWGIYSPLVEGHSWRAKSLILWACPQTSAGQACPCSQRMTPRNNLHA